MLVIREAQMDGFGQAARSRFEQGMVELFLSNYPRECDQAGGKTQIGHLVRHGVKAAADRGFTSKRQVSAYLCLMFILGVDFASDPQLPWVADLLDVNAIADPTMRIDNLFEETLDYLGLTAGENCERVVRAMLRIRAFDLADVPTTQGDDWITDVLAIFKRFYPEKFNHQGETATRVMMKHGLTRARRYGFHEGPGIFVFLELMFMLGSGFDHDPLHPWAAAVLDDGAIPNECERADQLYAATLAHIEQSLSSPLPAESQTS